MTLLARGDESSLGELIDRWQGPLWCFVNRMVSSATLADDITQDIWTRVFMYRKRYDPGKVFRSWLFGIAANRCRTSLSMLRRPWRIQRLDDSPAACAASDDPGAIDNLITSETHAELHRAIAALPDKQRMVVLLSMLYDSDYRHIAGVVGRRPSTVRSLMCHALRRLRRTLTKITLASNEEVENERLVN